MPTQVPKTADQPTSVSVGCIAFAGSKELASDSARYFSELQTALASVENITELRVENVADDQAGVQRILDPFSKEERFYAHPYNGLLYYKIFIHFKKQDELGFRCDAESFEVYNFYHYDHLVTYIPGCTAGGSCGGGGTSLALIREYLKTKLVDGALKVAIVGPSPFHATFWCSEGEQRSELFDISSIPGIKEYEFTHESDGTPSLYHFVDDYGETLALYYQLQTIRGEILDRNQEINKTVGELLAEPSGFIEKLKFRRAVRAKIDRIHRKVAEGNSLKRMIANRLDMADRDRLSYRAHELSSHFSDFTRISQEDTYNDALSIANVHEGRNRSFFENSSILIAGLAGGLLGALLTSLLSAH